MTLQKPELSLVHTWLDHIHTNKIQQEITLQYVPYNRLDHKLMFIEIHKTKLIPISKIINESKYINFNKLNLKLQESPTQINQSNDINETYRYFVKIK